MPSADAGVLVPENDRPPDAGPPPGPTRSVRGRVLDLVGDAVVGATILANGVQTSSGAGGAFTLVVPQSMSVLAVEAAGYRATQLRLPVGDGRPSDDVPAQDVLLLAVGTLGGTVTDAAGLGARGARIRLAGSGVWPPREATSDAQGRYAFDDVAEGVYELSASTDGAAPQASEVVLGVEVAGPGGAATADLAMVRAGGVAGRVATVDGRPVTGARLSLCDDGLSLSTKDAWTGPAGTYRTAPVTPGTYLLRVEAPDAPPYGPVVVLVGVGETTYHVTLPRGATVRGRVLDSVGQPVRGARVAARIDGEQGPRSLSVEVRRGREQVAALRSLLEGDGDATEPRSRARPAPALTASAASDADGRFTLTGLPRGRVRILAHHPGHGPAAAPPVELADGDTREVTLSLTAAATLSGRVVDELGNAMDGARVVLNEPNGLWERRVLRAGEGGRFRITDLGAGELRVAASESGHLAIETVVQLKAGSENEVELRLVRGNTVIEGLCTDADGTPVIGARITLSTAGLSDTSLSNTNALVAPRLAQSDGVGHFRFQSLPEGSYTVRADAQGHAPVVLNGVDGSDALEIRFRAAASVEGRVVDNNADTVAGATIELRRDGQPSLQTRSDAGGHYRFGPIPPASYELQATAPGHQSGPPETVVVNDGERVEQSLTLAKQAE